MYPVDTPGILIRCAIDMGSVGRNDDELAAGEREHIAAASAIDGIETGPGATVHENGGIATLGSLPKVVLRPGEVAYIGNGKKIEELILRNLRAKFLRQYIEIFILKTIGLFYGAHEASIHPPWFIGKQNSVI